jgi:hypothetical protein
MRQEIDEIPSGHRVFIDSEFVQQAYAWWPISVVGQLVHPLEPTMISSLNSTIKPDVSLNDFSDIPAKAARSKLEPHRELIRDLRRRGRTYREISSLFSARLGFYAAPSTIHSFVKVRARHKKVSLFELPPLVHSSAVSEVTTALEAKPKEQKMSRKRFVFRANEPLTLTREGDNE